MVAVRIKLVDASLGGILAGWRITGLLDEETSVHGSQFKRSNGVCGKLLKLKANLYENPSKILTQPYNL